MKARSRNKYALCAFIIPVLILIVYFLWRRIAPFGENSFLIHDMNAQYVDYFAYMRTVLAGENDFVYTLSRELGGDFRSFFSYYLISPFNLIPVLLPDRMIPASISCELLLLFGLAGLSGFSCLEKYAADADRKYLLYLSTAYSLSAWMLLNAENFQFIPEAVILPMVMAAYRGFKDGGKLVPLILWLTAAAAVNFYIGYMIFLFVLLWAVIPDGKRFDPRILPVFAAAAVCSAPVWLPAARMVGTTIKSADPDWFLPRLNFGPMDFAKKFLPGSFDADQYRDHGLPAVYCGMISTAGFVYYFARGKMTEAKRHRLVLWGILTASLIFRPLTMIWQGFSEPHWWPYRFSFLFIFVVILCASESRMRLPWLVLLAGVCGLFYNLDRTFSVKLADCVKSAEYVREVSEKEAVLGVIRDSETGIFRIGDHSPRTDNDAMHFSYSGITGFDSLADRSVMEFLSKIGYPLDRYTVRYAGGNTDFANDLLGVRYRISGNDIERSDITPGVVFITAGKPASALPESDDPVVIQNYLAADLGAAGPVLMEIRETEKSFDNFECGPEFCWTVSPDKAGSVFYTFISDRDGLLYARSNETPLVGNMTLIRDEKRIDLNRPDGFLPLGEIEAGKPAAVELRIESPVSDVPDIQFIFEDAAASAALFAGYYDGISVEKASSSVLRVSFPASDEPRTLAATIPYDRRWSVGSAEGNLAAYPVWGVFLGAELPAGVTEAVLRYR